MGRRTESIMRGCTPERLRQITRDPHERAARHAGAVSANAARLLETLRELAQVREVVRAVDGGLAEREIPERATRRDVGERVPLAVAPRVSPSSRESAATPASPSALAIDPLLAALARGPPAFEHHRDRRVADAVGKSFDRLTAMRCRLARE